MTFLNERYTRSTLTYNRTIVLSLDFQVRFASHVLVGAILGLLYWDIGNDASKALNNMSMIFFVMIFSMFGAMMPTLMTFPMELGIFKREHLNYWYSMKSYYAAKVMADLPFQVGFLHFLTYGRIYCIFYHNI